MQEVSVMEEFPFRALWNNNDNMLDSNMDWYKPERKESESNLSIKNTLNQTITEVQRDNYTGLVKHHSNIINYMDAKVDQPYVPLSGSEQEFLSVNSYLKGKEVSSRYQKFVTRENQKTCFIQ